MKLFRSTILILAIMLVLCGGTYATGTIENQDKAEILNRLGLLQGTEKGFELDRAPNRTESGVMLVRLLGAEEEAIENKYAHPFTDVPAWANDHIGYMYEKGLTTGVSSNKFGAYNLMDGKSYATFALRALGYSDSKGDFNWNNALEFSKRIGLFSENEFNLVNNQGFNRDELVLFSYNALMTKMKEKTKTLGEYLTENLAIRPHLALANNIIDKNKYEIIPLLVKQTESGLTYDYQLSNIKNYKELNVVPTMFIGVWEKPLSQYEILLKVIKNKYEKEDFIKYADEISYEEKLKGNPFVDTLDKNPHPSMFSVVSLYNEEITPTYFTEIPTRLSVGEHYLPLIPFYEELIKEVEFEVNEIEKYYAEKMKNIVMFSNDAIKIVEGKRENRMFIDKSKLPEEIRDFVYASGGTSNGGNLESYIYDTLKRGYLEESSLFNETAEKYSEETGVGVRDNIYVHVLLFNQEGEIIGGTLVKTR